MIEHITEADYEQQEDSPYTVGNKYVVLCDRTVPRTKERFHTFHSAYLHAFQVAEGTGNQVDIAHEDKIIVIVRPNYETIFPCSI